MKGIYQVNGDTIFHDPTPEMIRIFAEMDPSYKVMSVQPGSDFIPRFQLLRKKMVQIDDRLIEMDLEELKETLNKNSQDRMDILKGDIVSRFDVLHALSLSSLHDCRLCGWECGVNRFQDRSVRCGLGNEAFSNMPFTHIGEEPAINPAIVMNLRGCALKCRYCIDYETLNVPNHTPSDPGMLWDQVVELQRENVPVTSLEFPNPTESFHGLMEMLAQAPADFVLPVVLNCHLYGSRSFYDMAEHITDVWLSDLRYGNDRCARRLSGIDDYMKHAKIGLDAMRGTRVIVRILVLPGHVDCCHGPAIELLSEYRDYVWVSVLDQYVPEHEAHLDPDLSRRPTKEEILEVATLVDRYGLRNIDEGCQDFWIG